MIAASGHALAWRSAGATHFPAKQSAKPLSQRLDTLAHAADIDLAASAKGG